ncbi:hypothetical protein [Ochrobactrum chromiisoli]|uniref:Uncharacterized protein n=1 Tax=Ochrobactrum chromiisoli TaxID=2993941 RepID=A0ABT3QPC5_9HYPH|nr:hypothetical protein [Ochrobactrum chromiisoli]MCX2697427.1 hypothetical protein [Ochrobactrum chromiisoli]
MAKQKTRNDSTPLTDAKNCASNTPRTIARMRKQPRIVLKVEADLSDNARLINRASLQLAELIAQQIARDVLRTQSTSSTATNH